MADTSAPTLPDPFAGPQQVPPAAAGTADIMALLRNPSAQAIPAEAAPQAPAMVQPTGDPVSTPALEMGSAVPLAPAVPLPTFTGGQPRSRTVLLEWPLAYGGVDYEAIVITRPSAREVGAFFERLSAALKADPTAVVRFPIYKTAKGDPVPDAVLDALDDDDMQALLEEVSDFLPRRLRPSPEPSLESAATSTLGDGDGTAPRSDA